MPETASDASDLVRRASQLNEGQDHLLRQLADAGAARASRQQSRILHAAAASAAGLATKCPGARQCCANHNKVDLRRQGTAALWIIAMVRLRNDPATRAYAQRRKQEGLSHREIVRCIKRYLARRLHPILPADLAALT